MLLKRSVHLIVVLFVSVPIVLQAFHIKIDFQICKGKIFEFMLLCFDRFMDVSIVEFACAYWNGLVLFYNCFMSVI